MRRFLARSTVAAHVTIEIRVLAGHARIAARGIIIMVIASVALNTGWSRGGLSRGLCTVQDGDNFCTQFCHRCEIP